VTTTTTELPEPGTYYYPLLMELPDVDAAIDEAADSLSLALHSGTYRNGYERQLAGAVLANLDDKAFDRALWGLLIDRLSAALMTNGPLDGAEQRSYDVIAESAKLVFDAVRETHDGRFTVESMTTAEICERQEHIDAMRRMGMEPAVDFMRRLRAESA